MKFAPVTDHWLWCRVLAGHDPAEALDGYERDRLFRILHRRGWTDLEIATHTRWSTYTVARIRERLNLPPNVSRERVA